MKLQLLASFILPLIASAETFNSLCSSPNLHETTAVLDGVNYRYICSYRSMKPTGLISGLSDRAACAQRQHAAGCKESLTWKPDAGECYCSEPGWGTRTSNYILTLVRVDPGKEDRDALATCQTARDKYKTDYDTCQASSSSGGGTGGGTGGSTGGSVGTCPASGLSTKSGTRNGNWDIYCNSYVSPFNRYKTDIRAGSLDACIDVCNSAAEVSQCKGVTWENGGRCALYNSVTATGGTISARAGTHMAIRR